MSVQQDNNNLVTEDLNNNAAFVQKTAPILEQLKNGDTTDFNALNFKDILPLGGKEQTAKFLEQVFGTMLTHIEKSHDRKEKVLNFEQPEELEKKLDLDIHEGPTNLGTILNDCEMVCKHSVKTGHPRFFNQLSQGLDIVSLAGEWVTAVTNTNMFTYEVAPVYSCIERVLLNKMQSIIGWNTEDADGLFNPGGSISNMYAVMAARYRAFPEIKQKGLFDLPNLILYTSVHSHYSLEKAAAILGIGTDNVQLVGVDDRGRLDVNELEKKIIADRAKGNYPFFVALTAGSTVLGSFDPIDKVAEVCNKHKLWLHIDAAWGGGALLSKKRRNLFAGIEEADSVTWNPHKMMGSLLQCSVFLVKHNGLMEKCNSMKASYLFQQDKNYDIEWDTGDKTVQCGRHVDVLKVWLMWRAKGDLGFENQIEHLFSLADLLYKQCLSRPDFDVVLYDPQFVNICFWYVPKRLQQMDKNSIEYKQELNKIAPQVKSKMMDCGSMMVGYQPLDDKPNFFRAIISNAGSVPADIMFMLDEIERLGKDL